MSFDCSTCFKGSRLSSAKVTILTVLMMSPTRRWPREGCGFTKLFHLLPGTEEDRVCYCPCIQVGLRNQLWPVGSGRK